MKKMLRERMPFDVQEALCHDVSCNWFERMVDIETLKFGGMLTNHIEALKTD